MAYNNFYKLTYDINKRLFLYPQATLAEYFTPVNSSSFSPLNRINRAVAYAAGSLNQNQMLELVLLYTTKQKQLK